MFEKLKNKINNHTLSKEDIVETALQLDLVVEKYLPKEFRTRDIQMLTAFKLLLDFLEENVNDLPEAILNYRNQIKAAIEQALDHLKQEGVKAWIKNRCFLPVLGDKHLIKYDDETKFTLFNDLADTINIGKLAYKITLSDNKQSYSAQIFISVDSKFVNIPAQKLGLPPSNADIGAHISLHDGLAPNRRIEVLNTICRDLNTSVLMKGGIITLKDIPFKLIDMFEFRPKTNSTIEAAHFFSVYSEEIEELRVRYGGKDGIFSLQYNEAGEYLGPEKSAYWPHITFGLKSRVPDSSLTQGIEEKLPRIISLLQCTIPDENELMANFN